jgi:N-methylhydantoinase A
VYDRYKLFPGAAFRGPAIIEERESTVIVGEKAQVRSDEFGFLRVDLKEA